MQPIFHQYLLVLALPILPLLLGVMGLVKKPQSKITRLLCYLSLAVSLSLLSLYWIFQSPLWQGKISCQGNCLNFIYDLLALGLLIASAIAAWKCWKIQRSLPMRA